MFPISSETNETEAQIQIKPFNEISSISVVLFKMFCWKNQVALITDCEDEVGLNVIEQLSKVGMTAIGFVKTEEGVIKTKEKLNHVIAKGVDGKIVLCKCDIRNIGELQPAFEKIVELYGGVDVLINNAYLNIDCLVSTGELKDFKEIIDVNVYAVVACVRLAAGSMIERKTRGHIININDLCAYQIPEDSSKSVFIASKCAVTSVNEILRHEFRFLDANIKVTNIACGKIESESKPTEELGLKIKDVAKLVRLILNTPEHLQVHEVLLDSTVE